MLISGLSPFLGGNGSGRTIQTSITDHLHLKCERGKGNMLINKNGIIGMGICASLLLIIMMIMATSLTYAQTLSRGVICNCIMDLTNSTSSHHSINNITGLTIPRVKLVKNETVLSLTDGRLSWIALKSTQLMGILMNGFYLGNFTGTGTSSTVPLNTITVRPNESLGVQISGGTLPTPSAIKGEIVKADVNVNGTLGEIKTVGDKPVLFPLQYNKTVKKPVLGVNSFVINVKEPGYYLLLVSLGYDIKSHGSSVPGVNTTKYNSLSFGNGQAKYPVIAVFESVLKVT
jgi:hypothetical protein